MGEPEIQKSLALLKKNPEGDSFEDLTRQRDPPESENTPELVQELVPEDVEIPSETAEIPNDIAKLSKGIGWHKDAFGNPAKVDKHAVAFTTPLNKFSGDQFPYRTSWGFRKGKWFCFEHERRWSELQNPHQQIPQGRVDVLVTVFHGRTRKNVSSEESQHQQKKKHKKGGVQDVFMMRVAKSKNQLKKMIEKEIPFEKIPQSQMPAFLDALKKEWDSWKQYDSCDILSLQESALVEQQEPDRILPSRFVFRNKDAGLKDVAGHDLPLKAKARLCLQGHLCPDSQTGQVQVDSPTVERVSTMMFLHHCISMGWWSNWFIGDISNAFLQGAPLQGKVMYMRQPKQGLPGLLPNQLLRLLKPVYGRPDAPRAWFNELSRVLVEDVGFQQSIVDPATFHLRDQKGNVIGMLIVHVDDLMVATDDSLLAKQTVEKLHKRLPFGSWDQACKQSSGVTYCGKEIKFHSDAERQWITLGQNGFIDGRLEPIQIDRQRAKSPDLHATDEERTDFRSVVCSLQWIATQSRPDLSFETNQLQKRITDLRVRDLVRANAVVRDARNNRHEIEFHNLGKDVEIVAFHDASLFNSVGVEIEDRDEADVFLQGNEKKLVYSQKGAMIGFVARGETQVEGRKIRMNLVDWKSTTNKRVVESSLSAETHAAIMAHGLARFCQAVLAEIRFGNEVVTAFEDEDFQKHTPLNMITDCKSIYDHINKDGQHVSDKGNIVSVVLLRKMMSTRPSEKARLLWVPTRHQLADGLTKSGHSKDVRSQSGWIMLHEAAAKRSKTKTSVKSRKNFGSV